MTENEYEIVAVPVKEQDVYATQATSPAHPIFRLMRAGETPRSDTGFVSPPGDVSYQDTCVRSYCRCHARAPQKQVGRQCKQTHKRTNDTWPSRNHLLGTCPRSTARIRYLRQVRTIIVRDAHGCWQYWGTCTQLTRQHLRTWRLHVRTNEVLPCCHQRPSEYQLVCGTHYRKNNSGTSVRQVICQRTQYLIIFRYYVPANRYHRTKNVYRRSDKKTRYEEKRVGLVTWNEKTNKTTIKQNKTRNLRWKTVVVK